MSFKLVHILFFLRKKCCTNRLQVTFIVLPAVMTAAFFGEVIEGEAVAVLPDGVYGPDVAVEIVFCHCAVF